jgi:hypothetical protein
MRGLPQSATGQTTLFTGVNAAERLGHHLYGYPGPTLRKILLESSVLKRAVEGGYRAAFLNGYRPLFFELGEEIWNRPMSASSWNNRAAGLPFMTVDDIRERRALYHDFTNREPIERGIDLPEWAPEEAGQVLAEAAAEHDLAIYEYFLTDRVGHTGEHARARSIAEGLDRFIGSAVAAADLSEQTIVVTSDHGNIDDMTSRSHTLNPVPALVWGPDAARLAARLDGSRTSRERCSTTSEAAHETSGRVDACHRRGRALRRHPARCPLRLHGGRPARFGHREVAGADPGLPPGE